MKPVLTYTSPKRFLTPTNGFLSGYSHSLNPYTGCQYGCSYCYVRGLPVSLFQKEEWGSWVNIKQVVSEKFRNELMNAKRKGEVTIFMSSSTDPYQSVEHQAKITRSLIQTMVDVKPDFLFVQTRSPLVVRDVDLFLQLKDRIRISMTIETDLESIRKAFTPSAPPLTGRFHALRTLTESGLPTQAAVSPLLPCSDDFACKLRDITQRVTIDNFYLGDGSGGKRTERLKIGTIFDQLDLSEWYAPNYYLNIVKQFETKFRTEEIFISQAGFLPK